MSISERLRTRLRRDRPMKSITIRMPADVIEDLKVVAAEQGFSGYQPLIRYYVGQGLRKALTEAASDEPGTEETTQSVYPSFVLRSPYGDYTEKSLTKPVIRGARERRRRVGDSTIETRGRT